GQKLLGSLQIPGRERIADRGGGGQRRSGIRPQATRRRRLVRADRDEGVRILLFRLRVGRHGARLDPDHGEVLGELEGCGAFRAVSTLLAACQPIDLPLESGDAALVAGRLEPQPPDLLAQALHLATRSAIASASPQQGGEEEDEQRSRNERQGLLRAHENRKKTELGSTVPISTESRNRPTANEGILPSRTLSFAAKAVESRIAERTEVEDFDPCSRDARSDQRDAVGDREIQVLALP